MGTTGHHSRYRPKKYQNSTTCLQVCVGRSLSPEAMCGGQELIKTLKSLFKACSGPIETMVSYYARPKERKIFLVIVVLRNYFFWSLFVEQTGSESPELAEETHLSHMTATDSTWNPSLAASFKHASYEPRTNIQTSDAKETLSHSHSFTPATIINLTLLCC